LAGYTTPPGFRVERNDTRRRMRASPENRVVGIKAGPEYRRALDTCIARMKAVEGLGEAGVGSFVWYAKTGAQPSLLAEVYARDRRWAWIPSLGGYVRLAAEESEPLRPLMDFKAGEFAGCTNRGRTPGFASVTHLGFDTPRIRVRLPEPEVIDAARSGLAPAPVDERSVLLARVVKAMGAQGDAYDIDEVHQWMRRATVEELREWLASGVEGGAK
jgi:hypothetical protein